MEGPGLLSLSDEVLLLIFSYLDGIDKINIFSTCVRLNNVLCDRRLARKLKLIGSYSVTTKEMTCYLKPKMMKENMRVLDLTNCYWLKPTDVCLTVLSLKNLTEFYSVDVPFTSNHINKIVNALTKLQRLSFSWAVQSYVEEPMEERLRSLVFLYIHFHFCRSSPANWSNVIYWICRCTNVKQLWLVASNSDVLAPVIWRPVNELCDNRVLDTLVTVGLQNTFLMEHLKRVLRISIETFKCFWFPDDSQDWWDCFEIGPRANWTQLSTVGKCLQSLAYHHRRISLGKNGKIRRFYQCMFGQPFAPGDEQFEDLEELKLVFCFSLTLLQPLRLLTVLCIPSCCFSGLGGTLREDALLLPKWCPEIQRYEVQLCKQRCMCRFGYQESKDLLEMIAEWPKLRILSLNGCWNLRSGKAFDKIFQSCKNLQKLFLTNLGAKYGYVYDLTKALKNCKNLRDFRFEEDSVPNLQIRQLFEALTQCPLLERLVVVSPNNDNCPIEGLIIKLIEKSPKLIFLFMLTPYITQAQKKMIMETVTKKILPVRPALRCYFLKSWEMTETCKVPGVHLVEMVHPNISEPFVLPHTNNSFFEVPDSDLVADENVL